MLRLTVAGSPGGLTNVVQVFSTLDIRVERLEYIQNEGTDGRATLVACFAADDRTTDLLHRKITRLIEVLTVDELRTDCIICKREEEIS